MRESIMLVSGERSETTIVPTTIKLPSEGTEKLKYLNI